MNGMRTGTTKAWFVAFAAALAGIGLVGWRVDAQSLDLTAVNQGSDWAAGCGTDRSGVAFCAIQKSNGSRALGYVLERRNGGIERNIRISVDSVLIDAESPVTIQVDENDPLSWPVGYAIIDGGVISLTGEPIDGLLEELRSGHVVAVTVAQKTGEPISFELPLDGFTEAIAALEHAGATDG